MLWECRLRCLDPIQIRMWHSTLAEFPSFPSNIWGAGGVKLALVEGQTAPEQDPAEEEAQSPIQKSIRNAQEQGVKGPQCDTDVEICIHSPFSWDDTCSALIQPAGEFPTDEVATDVNLLFKH